MDRDMIACDTVWYQLLVSPVSKANLPCLVKLLGRGSRTMEFLLKDLSLGGEGEFSESLALHLLFFKRDSSK